jgi:hypothetical protein
MDNGFWAAFEENAAQRRAAFNAGLQQARKEGREEEFVMGWLNDIARLSISTPVQGFFGDQAQGLNGTA